MDKKLTLREWIASQETDDGTVEPAWLAYWDRLLPLLVSEEQSRSHFGDCTSDPNPCSLCMLEHLLTEYREYFFKEEE